MHLNLFSFVKWSTRPLYKVSLLVFTIINMVCCHNKSEGDKKFTLDGYVDEGDVATIQYLLLKDNNWISISDTVKIVNNHFQFNGNIEELVGAYLKIDVHPIRIYLEPKDMRLDIMKDRMSDYKLVGTDVEKENIKLRNRMRSNSYYREELLRNILNISKQIDLQPENVADSLVDAINEYAIELQIEDAKRDSMLYEFVLENRSFLIAPDLLFQLAERDFINIDSIRKTTEIFPDKLENRLMRNLTQDQIIWKQNNQRSRLGGIAPNFVAKDLAGDTVKFTDLKHKDFILLDFWASWCQPCLKGIPQIKYIHEKYRNRGLQIIGISIDDFSTENKWHDVINKYQINSWTQLINIEDETDVFFSPRKIGEIYDIQYIPLYILIDNQGKIIGRWQHIGDDELNFIDNVVKID